MRLHELQPYEGLDLIVHNDDTGHTVVLTHAGAVFITEDTNDLTNLAVAFGVLTSSTHWRIATTKEVEELRSNPPVPMMKLSWVLGPDKLTHLKAVT